MNDLLTIFEKLGLALLLGLLVGLQRERVQSPLAGIRTFALITLLGATCALLSDVAGGWVIGVGAACLAGLLAMGNLTQRAAKLTDPGLTTETAALVMYGVGAYVVVGEAPVAIALGGVTALLLHWKVPLHRFVAKIGETDLAAIMQLALITLVILPVLPDQTYGPFDVLNPRHIWLMVVFIVSISLGSYVVYKWLNGSTGAVLGGILGGLISSTATTVSSARMTVAQPQSVRLAALVVMVAATVSMARVLVEVSVVAPQSFWAITGPIWLLLGCTASLSAAVWLLARSTADSLPPQDNPAQVSTAIAFGAVYAIVTLAVAAAKDWLGVRGLYGVAAVSGLYDLDAIALSTASLVQSEQLPAGAASQMILIAVLSNQMAKLGIVAALGHRQLRNWMLVLFGAVLAAGGVILWWSSLGDSI